MKFCGGRRPPLQEPVVPSLTVVDAPFSLPPMSKLPFELLLALRYLRPQTGLLFPSSHTHFHSRVALGVAVLIIVISVDERVRTSDHAGK